MDLTTIINFERWAKDFTFEELVIAIHILVVIIAMETVVILTSSRFTHRTNQTKNAGTKRDPTANVICEESDLKDRDKTGKT